MSFSFSGCIDGVRYHVSLALELQAKPLVGQESEERVFEHVRTIPLRFLGLSGGYSCSGSKT